jgi:hypothetical protein
MVTTSVWAHNLIDLSMHIVLLLSHNVNYNSNNSSELSTLTHKVIFSPTYTSVLLVRLTQTEGKMPVSTLQ